MKLSKEYELYKGKDIEGVELDRLGKRLLKQIMTHMGMIRYDITGIRNYDLKDRDVGKLMDLSIPLIEGLKPQEGTQEYRNNLNELIEAVICLEDTTSKNGVVRSLKEMFARELRQIQQEVDVFEGLWEL